MNPHPKRVRTLALLGFVAGFLNVASAKADLPADLVAKVDRLFRGKIASSAPGCALGIVRDGALALERQYGQAGVAPAVPMSSQTRFELSSTSKQFTGTAIALLVLDGRLSLQDPLNRFFPEFSARWSPVKLVHLVHHTSGLPDYLDLADAAGVPDRALDEPKGLQLLTQHQTLGFTPGQRDDYSNTNYFLLSLIVKRVTGMSLAEFAEARIFAPLGMTHTQFIDQRGGVWPLDLSHGYSRVSGRLQLDDVYSPIVGDGGVVTTIEDLARWDANFYDNRLGYGEQLILMLRTPGRLNSGAATDYGFGLVLHERAGTRWERHAGEYLGYNSDFVRYPQKHLSVIVLCNRSDVDGSALVDQMLPWLL